MGNYSIACFLIVIFGWHSLLQCYFLQEGK